MYTQNVYECKIHIVKKKVIRWVEVSGEGKGISCVLPDFSKFQKAQIKTYHFRKMKTNFVAVQRISEIHIGTR